MLNCVIIDDEQHCIDTLTVMLKEVYAESITLLALPVIAAKHLHLLHSISRK